MKKILAISLGMIASSCSVIQNTPESEHIRLIFNKEFDQAVMRVSDCRYLGSVVGTEGHWYDYLFISNKALTYAALNDMRNSGLAIGANIIYVNDNIGFSTSVTFYGQAYHCELNN